MSAALRIVEIFTNRVDNGIVTLTGTTKQIAYFPNSSSNYFPPFYIRLGAGFMEGFAGDQVALHVEVIVNGIVNGQKTLH